MRSRLGKQVLLRSPLLLLACWLSGGSAVQGADALWASRPYQVELALDLSGAGLSPAQQSRLRDRLLDRLHNRLGRFWRVSVAESATAPLGNSEEEETDASPDKRITCSVRVQDGLVRRLRAREHDVALDHAGPELTKLCSDADGLGERLYEVVTSAFRPLARFRRDPEEPGRVTLSYLGAELAPEVGLGQVGEERLLIPFARRLKRGGEPVPEKAKPIRWTYLVAEAPGPDPGARVVSHSKRSLAGRAGGRVERLALAAPSDPSKATILRLHALSDPETPLPGYEVLMGSAQRREAASLGYSDRQGLVRVPRDQRVAYAHIRCGGLFVASLPVAPGVDELVEVPLIDERSRLRAELEVTSLREQLIDTAARRQLLSQRIRRAIDATRVNLAANLLSELDALPGRTQFTRQLDQVERQAPASHPAAKKRLDQLFLKTRELVTKTLDPRDLRDLTLAVDDAKRGAAESTEERPPNG